MLVDFLKVFYKLRNYKNVAKFLCDMEVPFFFFFFPILKIGIPFATYLANK